MSLAPGSQLGPYEILAPLGRGGMGVVFKARDRRLDRLVAIKVLPDHLAQDPVASSRFEREARAVAALNHPNILNLYDVGREGGTAYEVTELLEGETLRARLLRGPMPARAACEVARQVAQGLIAAHERGVLHRDLKPENLWLLADGRVKILDFGIAKRVGSGPSAGAAGGFPTLELDGENDTATGAILGSVGYMSPEQLRGLPLDSRSDLFSLGVVLWELVTGRHPFRGDSEMDTASAILRSEPARIEADLGVPPLVERILEHCLQKDPGRRFQSARDLEFALAAVVAGSETAPTVPRQSALRARLRRGLRPAAAAALVVAAAAIGWSLHPQSSRPRFQRLTFEEGAVHAARFARDGETVLLSAQWLGEPLGVFLARSGSAEARRLGEGEYELLAVSPADEIALLAEPRSAPDNPHVRLGRLEVVGLTGGTPLAVANDVLAADWFPDGSRLAILRRQDGRYRIESPPGELVLETLDRWSDLRVSPDGRSLAALRYPDPIASEAELDLIDVASRKVRTLVPWMISVGGLAWHPGGREIWYTTFAHPEGNLHAVTLDGSSRVVADLPGDVEVEDLAADGRALLAFGVIRNIVLARPAPDAPFEQLSHFKWAYPEAMSRDGGRLLIYEDPLDLVRPPLRTLHRPGSPPARLNLGKRIAVIFSHDGESLLSVDQRGKTFVLEVLSLGADTLRRFEIGDARSVAPVALLPDFLLALAQRTEGPAALLRHPLEGGDWTEVVPIDLPGSVEFFVSPDATELLFGNGASGYRVLPLAGSGAAASIAGLEPGERVLGWVADGRALRVARSGPPPLVVDRLDLAGGSRQFDQRVEMPGHEADHLDWLMAGEDGRRLVLALHERRSSLYVARDLR